MLSSRHRLIAAAAVAVGIAAIFAGLGSSQANQDPLTFVATFDGTPEAPEPFEPAGWDIQYHIRDVHRWQAPDPVHAHHGPNCEPPLATHEVTAWPGSVYTCADHMMTAINGAAGYGLIYVTPDHMVDFSNGEATIRFDISTLRSNVRDWWDVWITPFEQNLARPFELGQVDLHGTPPETVQVRIGAESQLCIHVYEAFSSTEYCDHSKRMTELTTATGDEEMARKRETVEIRISESEVEVTMPEYGETLAYAPVELLFNTGVVQFGHHSYTPGKDDPDGDGANTYHWDNIEIRPSMPFTMIGTDTFMLQGSDDEDGVVTLDEPAPENAFLRFAAVSGGEPAVSFDGGPFEPAQAQPIDPGLEERETIAKNYWTPIPMGAREVRFELAGTWSGALNRYASGFGVWAADAPPAVDSEPTTPATEDAAAEAESTASSADDPEAAGVDAPGDDENGMGTFVAGLSAGVVVAGAAGGMVVVYRRRRGNIAT